MKDRNTRLQAIKNFIKTNKIESQEQLLSLLQKDEFDVTQATLSRDLKLLRVGKISDGKEGYFYTMPDENHRAENEQVFIQDFLRGYVSIEWNSETVVIKTFSGQANSVANAVDNLEFKESLGTVAGDNCIFVALKKGSTGEDFLKTLKSYIPDLDE